MNALLFRDEELAMIRDALEILNPDNEEACELRDRLLRTLHALCGPDEKVVSND